jgi:type II secretory pathway component PulF
MSALTFRYKGYDAHGARVEGEISANTPEEAERKASAKDVVVTSLILAGKGNQQEKVRPTTVKRKGKRTKPGEAADILRSLAVMLGAGVPFVEALDGVIAGALPNEAMWLEILKTEIVGGKSVSRGMRAVPELFPPLVADIVRVAEEGGRLDKALASAAAYLERLSEFRKKLVNAMLYPALMVGISILTVSVLIIYVIPRFTLIFTKMHVDLPWTTKAMLYVGDSIRAHPFISFGSIVGAILLIKFAWRFPAFQRLAMRVLRKVPLLGDLMRRLAVSRAFSSISTLLGANVSVMAALEQGANVSGDPLIYDALMSARTAVERGATLFDSLSATHVIPPSFLQMIAVGERSGRLPSLLSAGAERMEEEVDSRLKAAVALIEPCMIVVMGGLVGTITVSIISPIYSVIEHIK